MRNFFWTKRKALRVIAALATLTTMSKDHAMKNKFETENAMETKFDQVSKLFAEGLTRRQSLRRIGGGLAGVIVGSLVGRAFAGGGNSDCAHWCNDNFPPGPGRGDCKSQAAHGTGPCYECGPAAPAVHGEFCGGVCCGVHESCINNACVTQNTVTCICGNGFMQITCAGADCSDPNAADNFCHSICTAQRDGLAASTCTPGC